MKNKAELFAERAHASIDQKRKYTLDPYIVHPRNVAYLVKIIGGSDDMIAAAYLHDVLEDVAPVNSEFDAGTILNEFGEPVLSLVRWLTQSPRSAGNREERKRMDRECLAQAPNDAKTIKLADLIDNSLTITEYDQNFAKVYLKEKRLLMHVLRGGDLILWHMADRILTKHGY